MAQGRVKWFSDNKGFGFIEDEQVNEDVFVHFSDVLMNGYRTLKEGQEVTYECQRSERGFKAVNVAVVGNK